MNVKESVAMIKLAINARRPLILWGPPGVGKSAGVRAAAEQQCETMGLAGLMEYGDQHPEPQSRYGFFDLRISDKDPVDMGGLPDVDPTNGTMVRLTPDWFPHEGRTDLPEHGILLIDEAPGAVPAVQATMYQICNERRHGDKKLKDGWRVILAGNRTTDGGVSYKFATPLSNRLIHAEVESDSKYWTDEVARIIDIHPLVLAFIRFAPQHLNTFEEFIKSNRVDHAFATERSWHIVSDVLHGNADLIDDPEASRLLLDTFVGTVGNGPGQEFFGFLDIWRDMPSIDGILNSPKTAEVPSKASTLYAVTTALAHRCAKDMSDPQGTANAVMEYLPRLPEEFAHKTFTDLRDRNCTAIFSAPGFADWARKNVDLF